LGEAEVDVEVAVDRRSRIAVALSTDFRSECHLDDFLLQYILGVFQQYRRIAELQDSRPERPVFGVARPFSKALRSRNFYARG
jgi:hypothetical protein